MHLVRTPQTGFRGGPKGGRPRHGRCTLPDSTVKGTAISGPAVAPPPGTRAQGVSRTGARTVSFDLDDTSLAITLGGTGEGTDTLAGIDGRCSPVVSMPT